MPPPTRPTSTLSSLNLAHQKPSKSWRDSTMDQVQLRFYLPCKPVLTVASLSGDGDYAELSSRYKASHVRLLLFWLTMKSQQVANERVNDPQLQVLAACCFGLQRSLELQQQSGLVMSTNDAKEASTCLYSFVTCFAWLALSCCDSDLRLFKCKPKLHYLMHTAEDLGVWKLNQLKLFATFSEESFLGRLKSISVQVHGKTLTLRVFQRYILSIAVSLHQFKKRMVLLDEL